MLVVPCRLVGELREFKSHEERHRAIFWAELVRRGQRRCRSYLLCGLGGFLLGFVTGILGRRAIAATTVAVERVVLHHLAYQLSVLRGHDAAATVAIASIVEEEQQHHDRSAFHSSDWRLLAGRPHADGRRLHRICHLVGYAAVSREHVREYIQPGQSATVRVNA
jgi:demethoxyubiquinone hydroxylase (CLK1/Coq7/Cat5 family)